MLPLFALLPRILSKLRGETVTAESSDEATAAGRDVIAGVDGHANSGELSPTGDMAASEFAVPPPPLPSEGFLARIQHLPDGGDLDGDGDPFGIQAASQALEVLEAVNFLLDQLHAQQQTSSDAIASTAAWETLLNAQEAALETLRRADSAAGPDPVESCLDGSPLENLPTDEQTRLAWQSGSALSHALARLFVQLGPPPAGASGDLNPTTSGGGGAQL